MNEDLLLVDDDVGAIRLMDRVLEGVGRRRFATSGLEALRLARDVRPDMVLLDAQMPGLDGLGVLRAMREDPELKDVPVIMVTSHDDLEALSLGVGAEDFILKPLDRSRLLARVSTRLREKQRYRALQRLALLDPLTELANFKYFSDVLEREWARVVQGGTGVSLMLLTVDDLPGLRAPSDEKQQQTCIRSAAWVLQDSARHPGDFVAHLGRGEFAVLLPNTDRASAEHVLRRIQRVLAHLELDVDDGPATRALSASAGIACFEHARYDSSTPDTILTIDVPGELVVGADQLLLAAQMALRTAQAAGAGQARLLDVLDYARGGLPKRAA